MSQEARATVRVTHRFSASPERVFDAFLDPMKIAIWMLGPATGEAKRIEVDPRVGGLFTFVIERPVNGTAQAMEHTGEYRELERPRRLAFTWGVPQFSAELTLVSLDFVAEEDGKATVVTLVHDGVLPDYAERTQGGWTAILAAVERSLG